MPHILQQMLNDYGTTKLELQEFENSSEYDKAIIKQWELEQAIRDAQKALEVFLLNDKMKIEHAEMLEKLNVKRAEVDLRAKTLFKTSGTSEFCNGRIKVYEYGLHTKWLTVEIDAYHE